jgi:hypothetical protein
MTDLVERLREYNEPPFDYIAHEAAADIELLRTQSKMYWTRYWDIAKEFDIMRRGLGCIADSDDVSVPNYVRQFARVLLGDTNE